MGDGMWVSGMVWECGGGGGMGCVGIVWECGSGGWYVGV